MYREEADVLIAEHPDTLAAAAKSDYELERNKPMPNRIHGVVQSALIIQLDRSCGERYQFASELSLDTRPASTPDLCIYPQKRLNPRFTEAKESEPPLTTIEIISPSQSLHELMHKAWDLYFPMGVKSAWIVVPELKGIHILLPNDEKFYFGSGLLTDPATGIQVDVDKVFKNLL
jgi:Uma2 family endonuclease